MESVRIFPSKTNFIDHYELRPFGQNPQSFGVDEIIHHKYPNPKDPYYGMSVLMAAAESVDINSFQHNYQLGFYKNSAIPPVVLETESKLTNDVYQRLKADWHSTYAGQTNVGKTAILEQGLKLKQFGINPKDLDWLATNRATRDNICSIFGVPGAMLGLIEDVNRASGETMEYTFSRQVIEPNLAFLDDRLTKDLAKKFDESLVIIHDSTVPYDDLRSAQAARERVLAGLTTINEEREKEGFKPVEGGDNHIVPLNMTTLENLIKMPDAAPASASPLAGKDGVNVIVNPEIKVDNVFRKQKIRIIRDKTGKPIGAEAEVVVNPEIKKIKIIRDKTGKAIGAEAEVV